MLRFEAYEGEVLKSNSKIRHGRGICFFQGRHLYEGWWKFGYPYGRGRFIYSYGYCFDGEFEDARESLSRIDFKKNGKRYSRISTEGLKKQESLS